MDRNLTSIGAIAAIVNLRVGIVRNTAEGEGIEPALVLDGVPYFSELDAERLIAGLACVRGTRRRIDLASKEQE